MKYVWAFNPFDGNKQLEKKGVALIRSIPGAAKNLEAVFVASPNFVELAAAFDVDVADRFTKYPRQLIKKAMTTLGIKVARCTVLHEKSVSLTKSAVEFANYLFRSKADLAFIASRAKKGLSPLVLGSFAESLVHFSKTDLLVFGEGSAVSKQVPKKILYSHDYSRAADKGLDRVIKYAKAWGCSLHIVHIPDPAFGIEFKGQEKGVADYRRRVFQKLKLIEKKLDRAGVYGSVELDGRWSPIAERLLERADEIKADFIVVVAKAGRLAAIIGGSVTRQILRTSPVPVLVIKRI